MTDLLTPADLGWHERRRQGIGGSDVAVVLGRHPYRSAWSLWAEKVGLIPPQLDQADQLATGDLTATRFGRDLEGLAALYFTERTGLHVAGEQMALTRPGQPWARCTVDGLVFDTPYGDEWDVAIADALGVLELKYTGQPRPAEVPEHHRLQVLWQMHVAGLERGWLATIRLAFGRPTFEVVEVERDDAELAAIVPVVERWWFDHVVAGEAPPVDGSDSTTDALKAVYGEPASPGASVELSDELAEVVEWLRHLKADAKRIAGQMAEAENVLRDALGDATDGRVAGFLAVSWRPQTARRVDVARARYWLGDAADVVTTSRVLRLHETRR